MMRKRARQSIKAKILIIAQQKKQLKWIVANLSSLSLII